ncbi:MAG: acyl-CoA dehydrogenase C-terminal domain-containing protein [Gammaproteobacteria bacterium]|nr:acyl-CoA dehydrogenase C-terminal domain-containing protein [Gammaproteobacteria bacterium]
MPDYKAPIRDIQFTLYDVLGAEQHYQRIGAVEASRDLVDAILTEGGKFAEEVLSPLNQLGDRQGCKFENGLVTTPTGFKEAYAQYVAGGWPSLAGNPVYGGQGLPESLSVVIYELISTANWAWGMYPGLSHGAKLTLAAYGTEEQKQLYLNKLTSGEWTGTMCLTESHCGTDLGLLKTRAEPQVDGSYRITGTKIFISAGDHDMAENIVHIVLARLPDAPGGTRGISLFIVPKLDPTTAQSNNVVCGSIEHKMGIKASATCVMNFEDSQGYLVGELNNGLPNMFTMMNYERLSMGLQGNGLAESSYQIAAEYAKERLQGRAPSGAQLADESADPILVHPDVRRMLLTMRANVIAGRALSLYAAFQLDIARFHEVADVRKQAEQLVALLIPVQKAYCTDRGFESCVLGQQVLGGHGYVAEWGLEQNVRDARIAQIYEGANGIQALDLMGRKTVRGNGELLKVLVAQMDEFIHEQQSVPAMQPYIEIFTDSKQRLVDTTAAIISKAADAPDEIGAASYAYMELMGLTLHCFMWQRILAATLMAQEAGSGDREYLDGLIKTGEFFLYRMLPRSKSLVEEIAAGATAMMAMSAEQF